MILIVGALTFFPALSLGRFLSTCYGRRQDFLRIFDVNDHKTKDNLSPASG